MAYDGLEVEIKLRASKEVASGLLDRLKGVDARSVRQIDHYFDDREVSFLDKDPVEQWLSVRDRRVAVINHKRFSFNAEGIATHSEETELVIPSPAEGLQLMTALGFVPLVTVDKTRVESELDGYLVAIDFIENLGFFIEIEAMRPVGTPDQTREDLLQYASTLGLDVNAEDHRGYPYLLLASRV